MLQSIAPASVSRWRAAGGSFTARAFAVNFGDEQADIHYEYKCCRVRLFHCWRESNNSSEHSRVDKSAPTFMRPSTRQNEGQCRMAPAAKMRMMSRSRTDNRHVRRPSHQTRHTGLMIYFFN